MVKGPFVYSGNACRVARVHVNRTRTPGHVAYAFNMSRLECVGRYEKHRVQSPTLFDRPPF